MILMELERLYENRVRVFCAGFVQKSNKQMQELIPEIIVIKCLFLF